MINTEKQVHIQQTSDCIQAAEAFEYKYKTLPYKCCFKLSEKNADILGIVRIRLLLTITVGYMIGALYCQLNDPFIFSGIFPIVYFWAEAIYLSIKKDAKEWYW